MNVNIPEQWHGTIPVFLLIIHDEVADVVDLDERGWLDTYRDLLRVEGTWHLVDKATTTIHFTLVVLEGEQPYYVARHFRRAGAAEGETQAEITAYGIGKKRLDGHKDRLWVFHPTGQICTGDDVDILGRAALAQM